MTSLIRVTLCFSRCLYREVRDLQSTDEHECRYIFIAIENFGKLALEVADVRLEVIALSHFDDEKVVVVILGLSARSILSEEYFSYLLEVVESGVAESRTNPKLHLSGWTES